MNPRLEKVQFGEVAAKWKDVVDQRVLTIKKTELLRGKKNIFTIGSCFAENIKLFFSRDTAFNVFPKMQSILAPLDTRCDELPWRDHLNVYSSASLKQEIDWIFSRKRAGDFIKRLEDYTVSSFKSPYNNADQLCLVRSAGGQAFWDPTRRLCFSKSERNLMEFGDEITESLRSGIEVADVFVATIGMSEVFFDASGNVLNSYPGYLGVGGHRLADFRFRRLSADENYNFLLEVVGKLRIINPELVIIFTASPVPLQRTFSSDDVFIANYRSKISILEALYRLAEENDDVFYFPSFEIVTRFGNNAFEEDLRHVLPSYVSQIGEIFKRVFF